MRDLGQSLTEQIGAMIRSMSRAQFIERMTSPFLIAFIEGQPAQGFHTRIANKNDAPPRAVEIFACVKAPGNPYLDRISIGRAGNCDIVLRDASVSKLHAHIASVAGGTYAITDNRSHNGTVVNGAVLTVDQAHALRFGDSLQFGTVLAKFLDAGLLYDVSKARG